MFGGKRDGFAQPQPPGFDHPGLARLPFGLVGRKDHMGVLLAQDVGENLVRGQHARPGVDQEQAGIGHLDRALGQAAHPPFERVVGGIFEPGRVDHGKPHLPQPRLALAQIARDAGLVVDERKALADEPVEQRGFADVGAANDGEGEGHFNSPDVKAPA